MHTSDTISQNNDDACYADFVRTTTTKNDKTNILCTIACHGINLFVMLCMLFMLKREIPMKLDNCQQFLSALRILNKKL